MIDLDLSNMYTHEFEKNLNNAMKKPLEHFERELITIRTGRAHPSMVEDVTVTCYGGSTMKIKEVAAISTPDPRMIVIQPWDASTLADIEKGLQNSHLGVTAANDGNVIRIQLPQLSSERREELVKVLNKKTEEARVGVRNLRNDYRNVIKKALQDKSISEDFEKKLQKILQDATDSFIKKADDMAKKKEIEITAI